MDFILKMIVAGLVAFPAMAIASDCHVVEYPDHYEAVCTGQESPVSTQGKSVTTTTRSVAAAQAPVTTPSTVKAPLPTATDSPPSPPSDTVKRFRDYSQQETQRRAFRDAAKISRIRAIRGQQNQFNMPVQNDAGSKP